MSVIGWGLRGTLLGCCLLLGLAAVAQAQSKTPVVFIPGYAGSYLCERDDSTPDDRKVRVWPGKPDRLHLPMDAQMKTDNLPVVPCGVMREPVRFLGIRVSDVYGKFVEHLKSRLGVPVLEYSYDWRLSVEHNARGLHELIKREVGGGQADIVAHSFGGLVARYYIQKLGGAPRVRKLFTMGTPHRGSVDTLETLFEGWGGADAGILDSIVDGWMGGPRALRKALLTFPSFYDMLPTYPQCCWFAATRDDKGREFDIFSPQSWAQFAFHKEIFPGSAEQAFLKLQLARSLKFHREVLQQPLTGHVGKEHLLVVTGWIDTATRIYVDSRTGQRLKFVKGKGDGTVALRSASEERDTSSRTLVYAPAKHMQIFMEPSALETLSETLGSTGPAPVGVQIEPAFYYIHAKDVRDLKVSKLEIGVTPGAVGPGGRVRLAVRLTREPRLASADMSNVRAVLIAAPGTSETALDLKREPTGESGSVVLAADLAAPDKAGAYLVAVRIEGLAELRDVFMVLGP
jgi:pimeloyl-ACP methyl ester carboxylesterase